MGRWTAVVTWTVLMVAAFGGVGPPQRPETGDVVWDLLTGTFAPHPAWLVAHFQWMGLWPLLVALCIRGEWRARIPAWPFVLGSFVLGCFVLLPWFVLRPATRVQAPTTGWFARWELPALVCAMAMGWFGWAVATGDVRAWVELARTDGFTWAMTWDFAAFWLVSVLECRARSARWRWAVVPLVGAAAVLVADARSARAG